MHQLTVILLLATAVSLGSAFSRNAISLGLVSDKYPLQFWDELAMMSEDELSPEWKRIILYIDRTRAGNEHWCCNHGRDEPAKTPVYNNRGEVVAWNTLPCENLGCCRGYIEVANHCLNKSGQSHLLDALDHASSKLGDKDTADLIALIRDGGGLIG